MLRMTLVGLALVALTGCGNINIGSGIQDAPPPTAPTSGLPGDRCNTDADCLSLDCNDGAQVCR